ncbi:uncharacterized protein LOC133884935 [Phragmites australis]|uniref:uncharacterized protein LOC133884935 n=1 Tax=Phragmites australis TaxID=29695 RepID=UPI002D780D5B|nr:uncharacterized protein LOC133884935 [Phragmites australis]
MPAEFPLDREGARQDRRLLEGHRPESGKGPRGEARGRRGHSARQPTGLRHRGPHRCARPPGHRGLRGRRQDHPRLHQFQLDPDRDVGPLQDRGGRPAVAGDGAVLVAWPQRRRAQHSQAGRYGARTNILAAWSEASSPTKLDGDGRVVKYNIVSGTSMSCPHVSATVVLLKAAHPSWSSAAIRSAIMTTATINNAEGGSIMERGQPGGQRSATGGEAPYHPLRER